MKTIDDILLEAINEGWFLKSKTDYPNGFTGNDVKAIQGKAKQAIQQHTEAVVREVWERVALETRANICDCGEKWADTDLGIEVEKRLAELKEGKL